MIRSLFALTAVVALAFTSFAEDKKEEKKLEGTLVCTKCELGETKACGHCLIVKEGDKEIKYYLKDKGAKEAFHKEVCQATKPATVTGGKLTEKDGKKTIAGAKVEITKK